MGKVKRKMRSIEGDEKINRLMVEDISTPTTCIGFKLVASHQNIYYIPGDGWRILPLGERQ